MVSEEYRFFHTYREKAIALRIATEDALNIITQVGPSLNVSNKYLIKRTGFSNELQDRLVRAYKELTVELKELISELNTEIKELDSMMKNIYIFGPDAFATFQRSAISHHNMQARHLESLYRKGINYFQDIEQENHNRYIGIEQSHDRFRIKLYEVIRGIVDTQYSKGAIIDSWVDCLEFLVQYLRDDLELGISRHTFVDLIEHESDPPTRVVLERYYQVGQGKHYLEQIEKHGLKRRARENNINKVSYSSLDEEKQKKIDKIIQESMLLLLEKLAFTDSSGTSYEWNRDTKDNSRGIKQLIEDRFKEPAIKKITNEFKDEINQTLQRLRLAINEAGLSFKKFTGNSIKGFEGLTFLTKRGKGVTLNNILKTDGNGLFQEKNFDELNYIMSSIEIMLRGDKPHESNNEFKEFLTLNESLFNEDISSLNKNNQNSNSKLWDKNKINEYFFNPSTSIFTELHNLLELIKNDNITDINLLKDSIIRSFPKFKEVIEKMLGLNTSSSGLTPKEQDLFFKNIIQVTTVPKNGTDALLNELYSLYITIFVQNYFDKVFLINKIQTILQLGGTASP